MQTWLRADVCQGDEVPFYQSLVSQTKHSLKWVIETACQRCTYQCEAEQADTCIFAKQESEKTKVLILDKVAAEQKMREVFGSGFHYTT